MFPLHYIVEMGALSTLHGMVGWDTGSPKDVWFSNFLDHLNRICLGLNSLTWSWLSISTSSSVGWLWRNWPLMHFPRQLHCTQYMQVSRQLLSHLTRLDAHFCVTWNIVTSLGFAMVLNQQCYYLVFKRSPSALVTCPSLGLKRVCRVHIFIVSFSIDKLLFKYVRIAGHFSEIASYGLWYCICWLWKINDRYRF